MQHDPALGTPRRRGDANRLGHPWRQILTGVDAEQEPFAAYSTLTGDSVIRHVADSEDVQHLREVLAYEQAHKARKGVVQAVETRLQDLSSRV